MVLRRRGLGPEGLRGIQEQRNLRRAMKRGPFLPALFFCGRCKNKYRNPVFGKLSSNVQAWCLPKTVVACGQEILPKPKNSVQIPNRRILCRWSDTPMPWYPHWTKPPSNVAASTQAHLLIIRIIEQVSQRLSNYIIWECAYIPLGMRRGFVGIDAPPRQHTSNPCLAMLLARGFAAEVFQELFPHRYSISPTPIS